jgi:hypothetical protein
MVLSSIGVYTTAQAADLPNISNTLSDSDPGATPSHTIRFTVPTGSSIAPGDDITVSFDTKDDGAGGQDFAGGNIGAVISDNSDLLYGVAVPAAVAPTFESADNDSFTISGVTASAGQIVEIVVASGVITNPATVDSYEIEVAIANAGSDSGRTRVAIVDNVLVSAIVDTVFDFTVSGLGTTTSVNGTTTTGATTPTEINFGTLIQNEPKSLAQRLNVRTNARNGFVVTVEADGDLESGNGAIIDSFADGSDEADPTPWVAPTNDIGDPTTWGHWGLTSNDSDLNSLGGFYAGEFDPNDFIAVAIAPREVFHHNGPSDNVLQDVGQVDVLYQIVITPLQEAANDYNTTLTYIATPTF